MALDSGYWEGADNKMTMDEVATKLVQLFAEYSKTSGYTDEDYATAVAIAVRMLSD